MSHVPVAAVILAAGASRRPGRPKQLIPYQGETLLARAIRFAKDAGFHPVVAVLGAERDAIRAAIPPGSAVFIDNDAWQEGIASSMRAGLRAIAEHTPQPAGVLMMPCDQPRLTADHLRMLLGAFRAENGPFIVASLYSGVRGVPALFPAAMFPQLNSLSGDTGARKLLLDPPVPVLEVAFPGGEVDIDSPDDLAHLL
jgi:molybdenum cofactor cytidylyltransferase